MGGKRRGWDKLTAQFDWSQRSGSMPQVEVQVGAVLNGRYGSAPEVRCLETSKVRNTLLLGINSGLDRIVILQGS